MCGPDGYRDAIAGSPGVEMKETTIGVEPTAKVRMHFDDESIA